MNNNDMQKEYTEALNKSFKRTYDEAWSEFRDNESKEKALDKLFSGEECILTPAGKQK